MLNFVDKQGEFRRTAPNLPEVARITIRSSRSTRSLLNAVIKLSKNGSYTMVEKK